MPVLFEAQLTTSISHEWSGNAPTVENPCHKS